MRRAAIGGVPQTGKPRDATIQWLIDAVNELATASFSDTAEDGAAALAAGLATKQNLDGMLTALSALVTAADKGLYFTGADAPSQFDLTAFARTLLAGADAATILALLNVTPWVAYTPTFTGFGTVTGVATYSRRINDTLHIRGRFTSGTSTAVEARMTMGFNGVNGGLTADAAKVIAGSTQIAGPAAISADGATIYRVVLIESGVAYITFGYSLGAVASLTKQLGNAYIASGTVFSFNAEIPITGW